MTHLIKVAVDNRYALLVWNMGEILVLQETDWWKKLTQKEDDTFYRGNNRRLIFRAIIW